jgi:head-tail adaptor
MSLTAIPARFYDKRVVVKRRTISTDSIGAVVETWNNIATNVPASIQPIRVKELSQLEQGKQFRADFKAFLPVNVVTVKNNDIMTEGINIYNVVGVEKHKASRREVTVSHHYLIYLEIINAAKS